MEYALTFPTGTVQYLLESSIDNLHQQATPKNTIIVTDENVAKLLGSKLDGYKVLSISPGEAQKTTQTIEHLAHQLIEAETHKAHTIVGIGGGMVTDIAGFLAGTYMRGLSFAFVPTTLLAMVDAAIGGKNGVNVGLHKNMLGTIRQPKFILYDTELLTTLPDEEWHNGFAEIIKYGCISDARVLTMLQAADTAYYQKHLHQLNALIAGCVDIKNKITTADESEQGMRRLLNFGHTAGHAFETVHKLPHGHAVALGMLVATIMSEESAGLDKSFYPQLETLLQQYGLPTKLEFDVTAIMNILKMDKKRLDAGSVNFVLLEKPGLATVKPVQFETIETALKTFSSAGNH